MRQITIPISDEVIRSLNVGDPVSLNGIMVTGRDAVHKWLVETSFTKLTHRKAMISRSMRHSNRC